VFLDSVNGKIEFIHKHRHWVFIDGFFLFLLISIAWAYAYSVIRWQGIFLYSLSGFAIAQNYRAFLRYERAYSSFKQEERIKKQRKSRDESYWTELNIEQEQQTSWHRFYDNTTEKPMSPLIAEYLKVLNLPPITTDFKLIKKQYRKLIKENHPDIHPNDRSSAEQRTKDIRNAFEQLDDILGRTK